MLCIDIDGVFDENMSDRGNTEGIGNLEANANERDALGRPFPLQTSFEI